MRRGGICARQGQASLIGLLVVVVIIMVAVYFLWLRPGGGQQQTTPRFEGEATTTLGRAMQSGQGVECENNLRQLRAAIQMESIDTGRPPAQLSSSWGAGRKCPVSGQPYQYDPRTGRVWCTTPGHEKF